VDAKVVGEALSVRFTATARAGAATRLVLVSGDGQSAPVGTALADSLVVRVEDGAGNPVAGVAVAWTASSGDISPATASSGADGRAAARRILGSGAGEQTATATAAGLAGSPVVFTHTAQPGTASSLVLISGSGQSAPPGSELPDPLVVRVVDASGNGIAGQAVTWIVSTGGGAANPGTSQTDGDGLASTRWTLGGSPGPNTLTAVASGIGLVTFSATATDDGGGSGPNAARSSVSADPTTIQAGTGLSTITVTVRNGTDAPVAGATVTLSASGSGNTLTQPAGITGADGVATGTLASTVPGTKVVTATVNGTVTINQTAQVSVTLAPATTVALLEGDGQTAEEGTAVSIRPAVRVTNDLGQPVAGFGVTFVVTAGGGSITGAQQTTNSDGVARVGSWELGAPGENRLEARAGSLQGSPVVFTATATASQEIRYEFTIQPVNVAENQQFTVQVTLKDASGATVPITGPLISLGLFREGRDRPSNNFLVGVRERNVVNGVVTFSDISVNHAEDGYRLRVRSDALPGATPVFSNTFNVD
jgi:adhesin/invasin